MWHNMQRCAFSNGICGFGAQLYEQRIEHEEVKVNDDVEEEERRRCFINCTNGSGVVCTNARYVICMYVCVCVTVCSSII